MAYFLVVTRLDGNGILHHMRKRSSNALCHIGKTGGWIHLLECDGVLTLAVAEYGKIIDIFKTAEDLIKLRHHRISLSLTTEEARLLAEALLVATKNKS